MATIGRNKAVVDLPNYHFSGVCFACLDVCSFILANRIQKISSGFLKLGL
jgi:hypothetical protein